MSDTTSVGNHAKHWKPFQTKSEVVASTSTSSLHSLPDFPSSSDMNVSSVIVPPKVPPRQRRGSDSAPCSPKVASPLKKRQLTLGGFGAKPGSPKIEALRNDPFHPPILPKSPPLPPPRGRFLRKGERTQSCADVLESSKKPKVSKCNSEDNAVPPTTMDDMFMNQTREINRNHDSPSNRKFFVLQPNSSSLMTTVIAEDTQAVSNDDDHVHDQTKNVPFRKDEGVVKGNDQDTTPNNSNPEAKVKSNDKENSSSISQKNFPLENSFSGSKNDSKNDLNETNNLQDKINLKAAKKFPEDHNIIDLQPKEDKVKENGCLGHKINQEGKNKLTHERNNDDRPKAVEIIVLDSGDIIKSKSTSVKQECDIDGVKRKESGDNLKINHDGKLKEETDNDIKDSSKGSNAQVPHENKRNSMNITVKEKQGQTRSTSNNELKTTEKQSSKKQGMFDVVGNFSAFSDVLPSVSSVTSLTKSLTNASTNIDVIGASKISKVVKFDINSKV